MAQTNTRSEIDADGCVAGILRIMWIAIAASPPGTSLSILLLHLRRRRAAGQTIWPVRKQKSETSAIHRLAEVIWIGRFPVTTVRFFALTCINSAVVLSFKILSGVLVTMAQGMSYPITHNEQIFRQNSYPNTCRNFCDFFGS